MILSRIVIAVLVALAFWCGYQYREHKAPPIDKYIADMQEQLDTQEIRITILERHLDQTGE